MDNLNFFKEHSNILFLGDKNFSLLPLIIEQIYDEIDNSLIFSLSDKSSPTIINEVLDKLMNKNKQKFLSHCNNQDYIDATKYLIIYASDDLFSHQLNYNYQKDRQGTSAHNLKKIVRNSRELNIKIIFIANSTWAETLPSSLKQEISFKRIFYINESKHYISVHNDLLKAYDDFKWQKKYFAADIENGDLRVYNWI